MANKATVKLAVEDSSKKKPKQEPSKRDVLVAQIAEALAKGDIKLVGKLSTEVTKLDMDASVLASKALRDKVEAEVKPFVEEWERGLEILTQADGIYISIEGGSVAVSVQKRKGTSGGGSTNTSDQPTVDELIAQGHGELVLTDTPKNSLANGLTLKDAVARKSELATLAGKSASNFGHYDIRVPALKQLKELGILS